MTSNEPQIVEAIQIVYQDENLIAVNKPTGWLVHRSWLDTKEVKILMLQVRNQIGQHVFPVHRLDKPTSGLLLMGLNSEIAHNLSKQFENQTIEKCYHALVRGFITEAGTVNYPLKVIQDKIADKFSAKEQEAQTALTHYTPLKYYEVPVATSQHSTTRYTLVELMPKTGRKHQLRRHMSHLRHPIIGDSAHGDLKQNRAFAEFVSLKRLMLHASSLNFHHPITNQPLSINANYQNEDDWKMMLNQLTPFEVTISDKA